MQGKFHMFSKKARGPPGRHLFIGWAFCGKAHETQLRHSRLSCCVQAPAGEGYLETAAVAEFLDAMYCLVIFASAITTAVERKLRAT